MSKTARDPHPKPAAAQPRLQAAPLDDDAAHAGAAAEYHAGADDLGRAAAEYDAPPAPQGGAISQMAMARAPSGPAPYLKGLNDAQREAVETLDGPVLMLAGAGTGKTRALTARLAHLIHTGRARPWEILAVTFTNKAAREMKERTAALVGPEAGESLRWLGTFHSISAQLLRRHAELAGLRASFTILDTDDQLRLIKQILEAEGIDSKRWAPRALAGLIDRWKNKALPPSKVPANDAYAFADGRAIDLYKLYQERLATLNAVDFGDLLLHVTELLRTHPDVLAEYHRRFKYILVDEYQDTNVAQYLWLRLLAQAHSNICVVGDDDQSIYGWRGAEVDNILRFEKDFPGAKVVRLEENYRSTAPILAAASRLISANQGRLGKTLYTAQQGGDKVRVSGVWDGEAEARMIADALEEWKRAGRDYADAAILVRAAWQMRAFEDRFIMTGLPYRVIGGPRFFERAEIRDAHAYLRLIRSESDDLAFERIVNTPKRGIGDASVQKIAVAAREAGVPMAQAARQMVTADEIGGRARTALRLFLDHIELWRRKAETLHHAELAELVLDDSGYTDALRADKSPQAATRLDNLKELVRSMGQFDTLEGYLEHVSLVMDIEQEAGGDQVQLMTLHAAKGLEWPLVFLPGWEEEVFPSMRSIDEKGLAGLEEERRLAYVGLTRAREKAWISFAANRQIYGRWQSVLPSRFIDELPPEEVEAISETGYSGGMGQAGSGLMGSHAGGGFSEEGVVSRFEDVAGDPFRNTYDSPGWRRAAQAGAGRARQTPRVIEGKAKLIAKSGAADARFKIADKVRHEKFGIGRVVTVEGSKLTIAFENGGGVKKVIDTFVERV